MKLNMGYPQDPKTTIFQICTKTKEENNERFQAKESSISFSIQYSHHYTTNRDLVARQRGLISLSIKYSYNVYANRDMATILYAYI